MQFYWKSYRSIFIYQIYVTTYRSMWIHKSNFKTMVHQCVLFKITDLCISLQIYVYNEEIISNHALFKVNMWVGFVISRREFSWIVYSHKMFFENPIIIITHYRSCGPLQGSWALFGAIVDIICFSSKIKGVIIFMSKNQCILNIIGVYSKKMWQCLHVAYMRTIWILK